MKITETYTSLSDVRTEIDRIDRQIVELIGERARCVKQAARFKKNEGDVAAPERVAALLSARREWAHAAGISPDLIETLFREMVGYFIATEAKEWRSQHSNS